MTRHRELAVALVLVLTASACTSDDEPTAPSRVAAAGLRGVECPSDVTAAIVNEVACAYVTVPESRAADASDRTVDIFVVAVSAGGPGDGREPVLAVTTGQRPNYSGVSPLVDRVGRDLVLVEPRGVGHSIPTLDCPEVEAVTGDWSRPDAGAAAEDDVLTAVSTCRARLTADGVDVAAYGLTESAQDLEAVRGALDIERWDVTSYGASSRLALEYLRVAPDRVRALVMDSPETPGTDPRRLAGPETVATLERVLARCAADPTCSRRYDDPESLLDRALARVGDEPVELEVLGRDGPTIVVLDEPLLVRLMRQLTSDASTGPLFRVGRVPEVLDAVVTGRTGLLTTLVGQAVQFGSALCLGYRTHCLPAHTPTWGAVLTVLCRDVAPFAVGAAAAQLPRGFDEAYGDGSPWADLCEAWDVEPAAADVGLAPAWDGPVLVFLGRYDPYTDDDAVREAFAALTGASYVTDPGFGFNVLPRPCVGEVRNEWLDDPVRLDDDPCKDEEGLTWDE